MISVMWHVHVTLLRESQQLRSLFPYLFLTVLGLCCCVGFSLVAATGGYSLIAVFRLLIVAASSYCGAQAQ